MDPTKVNRQQQAYFDALKALKASMNYAEHDRLSAWQEAFFNQLPNEQLDDEHCTFYQQVLDNFRDWGGTWSPHAWSYMEPICAELKSLSDRHNFKLMIVCFPVRPQVEASTRIDYPQRRLRDVTADLGIPYLDMLPILIESHRSGEDSY